MIPAGIPAQIQQKASGECFVETSGAALHSVFISCDDSHYWLFDSIGFWDILQNKNSYKIKTVFKVYS